MQDFILNIGLNVGYVEPKIQLDRTIFHLNNTFGGTFKDTLKEGNNGSCWGKERVLIVEGKTSLSVVEFNRLLENLCFLLSQDAIPFCLGTDCNLSFNANYKGGRCSFEERYFLRK